MADCELSGTPIFIDGRVPCHCCGRPVKVRMVDGLWCYAPHEPDGSLIAAGFDAAVSVLAYEDNTETSRG